MTGIPGWQAAACRAGRREARGRARPRPRRPTAPSMTAAATHRSIPPRVAAVIAPVERARTLPAAAYLDPEVFAWEQRWFFDHGWVCLGSDRRHARAG